MASAETNNLKEMAQRIREMREITGLTASEMAEKTEVSLDTYMQYESGEIDLPFTFIHKCSLIFNIGMSDLLEGQSSRLSSYTVSRKGHLQDKISEYGIAILNMEQNRGALLGYLRVPGGAHRPAHPYDQPFRTGIRLHLTGKAEDPGRRQHRIPQRGRQHFL